MMYGMIRLEIKSIYKLDKHLLTNIGYLADSTKNENVSNKNIYKYENKKNY